MINSCKKAGISIGVDELVFILQHFDFGSFDGTVFVPPNVLTFLGEMLETFAPKSVLNPWANIGIVAISIQQRLGTKVFDALGMNKMECEVFRLLEGAETVHLQCTDPLQALQESEATYDAAIGIPPFGMRSDRPVNVTVGNERVTVSDQYGFLLVLTTCLRLKEQGVGVFILPTSFFFASGRKGKARNVLEQLGIRVTSAIELPIDTFGSRASISSHIVTLQRTTDTTVFAGRFSIDPQQQKELLSNLTQRTQGKLSQNGRLVEGATFRGFSPIELAERIEERARRIGLVVYSFGDVVLQLNAPASSSTTVCRFEEQANAVYLPQMASTSATTSQDDLPEGLKSYYQLIINPEIAEAEFVARLLNTSFGQLWRDSLRTGDIIPRIGKAVLSAAPIYLPPPQARTLQTKVLECQSTLTQLRNELNELESRLWQRPTDVNKALTKLRMINREDRFEDWVDTLPFPLASILWLCHTETGSLKEQYERKIHFFEALTEFMAILHLSAFSASPSLWAGLRQTLMDTLKNNSLSLEMATLGTWKTVVEVLFAQARRILNDDPELCFELFKTRNRQTLEAICSKQIVSIIQTTNKMRNDWMGHKGAVRESDAKRTNDELQQHIQTVRGVFGLIWEAYELLQPGECKLRAGVFTYKVKMIVGTRMAFRSETVEVVEPMEDGLLYLKSPDESRSLKLLPFVKVMPSPRTEENACYFYNRQQKEGIRFLSYHFEADADIVREFADAAAALKRLTSGNIT